MNTGTVFTTYDYFSLGIFITRYIVEVVIVVLSIVHLFNNASTTDAEQEPLIASNNNKASTRQYGTTTATSSSANEQILQAIAKEPSAFDDLLGKMKKLLPYIWPHHDFKLQSFVVLYFLLMCCGFAVNLLAPRQIGIIVDNLRTGTFTWIPILAYIGLKFLQGGVSGQYVKCAKISSTDVLFISLDFFSLCKIIFGSL